MEKVEPRLDRGVNEEVHEEERTTRQEQSDEEIGRETEGKGRRKTLIQETEKVARVVF